MSTNDDNFQRMALEQAGLIQALVQNPPTLSELSHDRLQELCWTLNSLAALAELEMEHRQAPIDTAGGGR
jgi:hypothetical protein